MTVHEFLAMIIRNVESVDMGDTKFVIRTPEGDFTPYAFDWDDNIDGKDALVLDVLGHE